MKHFKRLSIVFLAASLGLFSCAKEKFMNEPGTLLPKTVDNDPSLPSIFVNNTQLHSEAFGNPDSAMIVVLHGGPGSDYRHLLNCKEFANNGYYVVFYDQRGSGLSKRHPKDSYSLQLMFDDLSAVIAHYRTSPSQKIFLLGHSWGAMLATAYINKYPAAVKGAIIAEPGGFVWQDVIDYVARARALKITSELLNDVTYSGQFITGYENEHEILDYKHALLVAGEDGTDIGNEGKIFFWRGGAVVNQALFEIGDKEKPDWTTNLQQFTSKILFVYSQNNKAYGLQHAQKVSSAYPNVELFLNEEAGHDMISFPRGWNHFYPKALSYFNSIK